MELLKKCDCGFVISILKNYNDRQKLKVLREQLITSKLFGCQKCVRSIKNKISKLVKE